MSELINHKLVELINSFQQLPYLFVGTGTSIRYANAPSWDSLLLHIWKISNSQTPEKQFSKLRQGIEYNLYSERPGLTPDEAKYYINPRLATALEKQFCDNYYTSPDFDSKVFTEEENIEILDQHYNPFKYYVAKYISTIKPDKTLIEYQEISSLSKNQNKIAGIITTNYDTILENIFHDFTVMVGQDNLLVSNSFNIFEIYKIHGSIESPDSIVLTDKDYENFESRLKYLSAKLLTLFVEHPIIFIGYGLGDTNIRNLFTEIANCLNNQQLESLKDNFLFITPAIDKEESYSLRDMEFGRNHITMHEFVLKDYSILYNGLSSIQSSLPIKLARTLQDMVCNFVYSANAKNTVIFGDINSPEIDDGKAAIFFGRSDTISQIGFSYYTIDAILEDVLFDNKPYLTNTKLIEQTFKTIRSSAGSTLLPIYKYIKALNYDITKIPANYNIIRDYGSVKPTSSDKRSYLREARSFSSISEIEDSFPDHIPKQVAYIKNFASAINADELGEYLIKYFNTDTYRNHVSLFRKLIALYDYKKYA
ncbi:hypothetical protein GCM10023142_11150 [Anaerocolumna aminovalerica]|uniref:SIR2-like domain-containing protein n=1 Tax=Anaerocolumna aminovalerica TaxID=1527 RepID=A0A1I5IXP4_9FIRM|nr:SIR2 family protein [Anaerocolumna aminovalerica]SFO65344.1 SIR2-like domain-containing protein [Anaerocolumna aminovalerica]